MITFKKATENDIELIRDLAKKSWNSAYAEILTQDQIDYMLGEMYSAEEIKSHLKNPDFPYYIIWDDENAAGFVGFEFSYEKNTTKLHRIYLLAETRGKGIGKATLDLVKNEVKKFGNKRIILNVNKINPAKKIYESQGFRVYDDGVFDIGNGFVMDDFLMEFLF
ncbi:GNAT family N-acetyltransferase [Chryseobacterium koreense]|uniref:GNAT family N-acetyltransferase n=1 Tax=Chryseobacterium koreense TaxID=232216 RepID=UPI0026EB9DBD|nr:GNAT family N-acetyltransferase [Chryseobacterium koreense]